MRYIIDEGRRVHIRESDQKSMRWSYAATIFGVQIGGENENSTTTYRDWYNGSAQMHHYLCGSDANPPATRTFAQG